MIIKAAFATDDGTYFMGRHFGDAEFFDIYEINENRFSFIKRISNKVKEEKGVHADPEKAKDISQILSEEEVNCAVSKIFGPNIKRIRKIFVCILMDNTKIEEAVQKIQKNFKIVENEWLKGEVRNHISLKA